MKILYGIQGTGLGHISRARDLLPVLSRHAEVEVLVSACEKPLPLDRPVSYLRRGISFTYDRSGGISFLQTLRNLRPVRFMRDVRELAGQLGGYDLVISDFEPVTAWAARRAEVTCVGLSHQAAFLSEHTPRPPKPSAVAEALLTGFAPADRWMGFHFRRYDDFIHPPIIRRGIRELETRTGRHITVYLPAFGWRMLARVFADIPGTRWHVFAPGCGRRRRSGNVAVHPVGSAPFLESLAGCRGLLTGAGFESTSEAMYLGKKLMVMPIRHQYEQLCNAAALRELGVRVLESLEQEEEIRAWLEEGKAMELPEHADPGRVAGELLELAAGACRGCPERPKGVAGEGEDFQSAGRDRSNP